MRKQKEYAAVKQQPKYLAKQRPAGEVLHTNAKKNVSVENLEESSMLPGLSLSAVHIILF